MERTPMRIVTVCTHNRTRSPMTAALLDVAFAARLGSGAVEISSAGVGPGGIPAIRDAVDAMARRGIDLAGHRSRKLTAEIVERADLLLTAERDHVVTIATLSTTGFSKAFTFPEFVRRAAGDPVRGERPVSTWIAELGAERTPLGYLRMEVPEIADPTGSSAGPFERAVQAMEAMCADVVDIVSRQLASTPEKR